MGASRDLLQRSGHSTTVTDGGKGGEGLASLGRGEVRLPAQQGRKHLFIKWPLRAGYRAEFCWSRGGGEEREGLWESGLHPLVDRQVWQRPSASCPQPRTEMHPGFNQGSLWLLEGNHPLDLKVSRAGSRRSCFPPTPRPSPWSPWGCVQSPAQQPSAHWAPVPSGSSPVLEPPSEQSGSHPQPSLTCGSYVRCGGGRGARHWLPVSGLGAGTESVCCPRHPPTSPAWRGIWAGARSGWVPTPHPPPRTFILHKRRVRGNKLIRHGLPGLCVLSSGLRGHLGSSRPSGRQGPLQAAFEAQEAAEAP
ncbi:uncharacterized protein LOC117093422 [Trachypithecus francoisi]|uniref:uncharacterized protein LOC117093422 n=1 Tax=Trachypithecus francoisi TaxID=54180 RepID=UPI00141B05A7|nr:uncharacterized protein LOC117093422 [Trachypithecus francoisi]